MYQAKQDQAMTQHPNLPSQSGTDDRTDISAFIEWGILLLLFTAIALGLTF